MHLDDWGGRYEVGNVFFDGGHGGGAMCEGGQAIYSWMGGLP